MKALATVTRKETFQLTASLARQRDQSMTAIRADARDAAPGAMGDFSKVRVFAETAPGVRERDREGTVRFPGTIAVAGPDQSDSIASTLGYKSSVKRAGVAPDPGDFGTTRPFYAMTERAATLKSGTYQVTANVNAEITFQVASPDRTNIQSDADPSITQTNYPDVSKDLTPSPDAVTTRGVTIYAGQPPRLHYWAEDLTVEHEKIHADEDVKFGQEGVQLAQDWLNRQTAASYDDFDRLFPKALDVVVAKVNREMALPGREARAYKAGAPSYAARAAAIQAKGQAKGYVPKPADPKPKTPAPK